MAGKDIKPKTETGLTRREVLGKALRTGAGALASDVLDSTAIRGLADLLTGEGKLIKVPATSLNQNVRKLLSLGAHKDRTYLEFFDDVVSDKGVVSEILDPPEWDVDYWGEGLGERDEQITEDMQEYIHNMHVALRETEQKMLDINLDIQEDLRDQGYSDDEVHLIAHELQKQSNTGWDNVFYKRFSNFRENISKGFSIDHEIKELKDWADRGYYGSSSEVKDLDTLYDRLEKVKVRASISPDTLEESDNPTTILDEEIRKAIKIGQEEANFPSEEAKEEPVLLPEPSIIEDRLKDIATTRTFKELRRALGKLGAPKPEAIEGPKPEAPKQIESKSPVQMANIASALSKFKRATPIGAAAAMYQPSPAGERSDIVPPYPLIRPQF